MDNLASTTMTYDQLVDYFAGWSDSSTIDDPFAWSQFLETHPYTPDEIWTPLTDIQLQDLVESWHEEDIDLPLHVFLKMSWHEYGHWVMTNEQPNR